MSTNNKYLDRNGVRYLYHNIIKPYVDSADSVIKTDIQALSEKCEELEQRMIPITHDELVSLRDAGNLIPGMQYRITDYEFTTLNPRLKAKPSTFDIIVTADDDHTLNEDARAVARELEHVAAKPSTRLYTVNNDGEYPGVIDTADYFEYEDEVEIDGQTLYKWRKYEYSEITDYFVLTDTRTFVGITADNPYTPIGYGWTDANGQYPEGGSHRDKDVVPADGGMPEPRDYAAWELKYTIDNVLWSASKGQWIWTDDEMEFERVGTIEIDGETWVLWYNKDFDPGLEVGETKGYYASYGEIETEEVEVSLVDIENKRIVSEDYGHAYYGYKGDTEGKGTILWLKDEYRNSAYYDHYNVLVRNNQDTEWRPTFAAECYDNIIGPYNDEYGSRFEQIGVNYFYKGCYCNRLGANNKWNTLTAGCFNNTFGNSCSGNTFGNGCKNITFGSSCSGNTFGPTCSDNMFGSSCSDNTFGPMCSKNTFGVSCFNNKFTGSCYYNTFDNSCSKNTFADSCSNNTFGSSCSNNTFGSTCRRNTFGSSCSNNTFGSYCRKLSIPAQVFHASVLNSTNCEAYTKITINFAPNKTYCQYAGKGSSSQLKIWVPADLV